MPVEFYLRLLGDVDQPSLQIKFEIRGGNVVCASIHLDAKPRGRDVIADDFEKVRRKLANWTEVTVKAVMQHQTDRDEFAIRAPDFVSQEEASAAFKSINKKQKRRKVTDRFLMEVADLYREFVDDDPWQTIADQYTVTKQTAARYIVQARKAGYLPKTTPGRKKA